MGKENWTRWDLLAAILIALIVVGDMLLAITVIEVDAETPRVETVMSEAQERIDAYYASLPARERAAVVTVDNPPALRATPFQKGAEGQETPAWYIEAVPLDRELQKALWDACGEFDIDYSLALAVIEQETRYQNLTGDGGDSVGYFQVQPRWWGGLLAEIGADDLTDPAQNFRAGCAILAQLLDQYGGSVEDALTAYNTGHPGASEYARAVMERAEV